MQTGDIHVFESTDFATTKAILNGEIPGIKLDKGNLIGTSFYFVCFQMSRDPFTNLKFRQAINYAIDRDEMAEITFLGLTTGNISYIPRENPFYNPEWQMMPDLEKAKQALAASGYPEGTEIGLLTPKVDTYISFSNIMAAQLKKIGINVKIEVLEGASYAERVVTQEDFDMRMGGSYFGPDPGIIASRYFYTDGPSNYFGEFSVDELDNLIDEANQELDFQKRYELVDKMEKLRIEIAAPLIVFSNQFGYKAMRDEVQLDEKLNGGHVQIGADLQFEDCWIKK
jgi:peptide/nickel transport system substrate-binding protein